MTPFWISAFLDLEGRRFTAGAAFWAAVTGYDVSPLRGPEQEFATLVPPAGDDFLRLQRRLQGPSRLHLDLHVTDPQAAADRAALLGARIVERHRFGYVVMASPAGITFCFVTHPSATRPATATWPGGLASRVDQVAIDLPPSLHDADRDFWAQLTGWSLTSATHPEMTRLRGPSTQPIQFLVHRLDDEGPAGLHLDLAASDVAAEVERHLALGATVRREGEGWVVLTDPTGLGYCVTPRDPGT